MTTMEVALTVSIALNAALAAYAVLLRLALWKVGGVGFRRDRHSR